MAVWPLPRGGGGTSGCTVRVALCAAVHHSFDKVAAGEKYNALRGRGGDAAGAS